MEKWQSIPGFEGKYEASSRGRMRRIGRGRGVVSGRILKSQAMPAGYRLYTLWAGNQQNVRLGHRLVAAAFFGPCPQGYEVNHKNFDKADNRSENLEYVTRSANLAHRSAAGIMRGQNNPQAVLRPADILTIRQRHADGEGYKRLASAYGVSWEAIRNIIKRRSWAWVAE